jgi:protoporphyrinogen oxidase
MVERIPKPPRGDVIKSAQGVATEGYTHQLYFHYPREGGFQTLVNAYARRLGPKCEVVKGAAIQRIFKQGSRWQVQTDRGRFECETLLNCMPLHELFQVLDAPDEVRRTVGRLQYNAIHIVVVQAKKDSLGDNFALYLADPSVIFHRLSKLNFLGESYCLPDGGSTLMAEITFRPNSYLGGMTPEAIKQRVLDDLERVNFVRRDDVLDVDLKTFHYAYVIYDLHHRANTDAVLNYLKRVGIRCAGRFAEFEYLNSDGVVEHTQKLALELNGGSDV